ncbi:hypothetical protein [Photobacterium leiognathi]|uniref:hypothetical protein n=1 Tax=Photobacterium leiognathi TaxID=553611 RepID=UPI00298194CA|nr:hypothetical protein [Photobacterium leiognathi]
MKIIAIDGVMVNVKRDILGEIVTRLEPCLYIENKANSTDSEFDAFVTEQLMMQARQYTNEQILDGIELVLLVCWKIKEHGIPVLKHHAIYIDTAGFSEKIKAGRSLDQTLEETCQAFRLHTNSDIHYVDFPVRAETLTTAEIWTNPTGDEVRTIGSLCIGMGLYEVARFVGVAYDETKRDSATIRNWYRGSREANGSAIPYAAWAMLVERAGFGKIQY